MKTTNTKHVLTCCFHTVLFAIMGIMTTACCDKDTPTDDAAVASISGTITIDMQYGTPQPDFTAADMMSKGFAYGDLLHVVITDPTGEDDDIDLVAPFVTAYTQAGLMGVSWCDYGAKGGVVDMGLANGSFQARVGGKDGDKITITMKEKQGYRAKYDLLQGSYDNIRDHYPSDTAFANFREVKTTGMGEKKLYRGSNPLNADKNPVRYAYMDDFARQVGVQTEIDLADDDDMIQEQLQKRTDNYTYCPTLYKNGKVVALKMSADTFNDDFKERLARGLRFMIANEPPYLIHCNEGKDRCGFVTLLLESLMGASVDEIQKDYMVTFENYYKYKPGSDNWDLNESLNVNRMLTLLLYPDLLDDITHVNWDLLFSSSPTALYYSVVDFLKSAGLTDTELEQLKAKLK